MTWSRCWPAPPTQRVEQLEKQLQEGSQMAEHCKRLLAEARAGSPKFNAEIAELRAAANQQTDERDYTERKRRST